MLILRVPTDPIIADYEEDCLLYENTQTLLSLEVLAIKFPSCILIDGSYVTLTIRIQVHMILDSIVKELDQR
jgi:hypothetical protein